VQDTVLDVCKIQC